MVSFSVFCIIIIILSALVSADDVLNEDDDKLIEDEQWFQKFHDCLMEIGPCPDDIKKYTGIVPVYLKTACGPCSPKEKELFELHKALVAQLYPKMFSDLKAKFSSKPE